MTLPLAMCEGNPLANVEGRCYTVTIKFNLKEVILR